MAWYDDPNFVNSSPLAPLPTVGITPALPAAPRALNPEPAKPVSDPFADLDAAMTRLAYPEETDTTPSGLAGIPENTAPVVTLEGINQRIANKPEAPWVFGGDTLSAAKDYISNIPTFAKSAFYRLTEDDARPDQYSPGAKAAFEEEARAQQQVEEERLRRERAGESTQVGSAIREAIPSSGFSLGSMGAAAAAGIPAAGLGTLAAGPVGGIVGGITGSMAGSGAAAYRMQRSTFLEDSFKAAEDKSLKENGRSLNEPEKQQLYNELLPLANDSALWEAGPEAIGNAATLVGGGIALKLLGKGALSQIAGGAMKKAAIRAGAATAGVATELGTETATQKGQALADARRDAVLEGKPIDEAVSRYDMPGGGGTLQAFKDIAAPTLGTMVMFGLAGGAVKGGTKAYERIVTNPREAEEIVKLSNDPNIVAALPDSSLKNLSRMSEWLGNQWFQGPERKQLLDNALIKLNAEIANRESESGEIKAERKKTLQSLWDTMGPQEQLGVLGFLQNESVPMTGWVDKEGNALTDKQGRALGEIDVRGLAKLAPVLGLSGDVLQKNFEKVRGDWYARQEANQQQQPSLLVDDYGREIDPKLVGATVPITSTSPSKQQQKQQTPLANLADAVPPTSLVPLPIETLTEKQKKDHVKNIAKISSTKATPEERASAESFLNQFSVVGSRPMDIAFGAKQKSTGVDSTAAPPIAPIEPNIADPNAAGKSMLDEALARQQAEKAKQATQTPPVVEPTDSTPQGATPNAETTPIGNGPAIQEPGIQVGEIGSQQPGSLGGFDRAGEVGQGQVSEVSSQGPEVVNKTPPAPTVNVGGNTVPTVTSGSQAIIQAISDEAAKGTGNSSTSQLSNPSLPSVPSSVSAPETPVVSPNTNVELPTVQPVVAPVSQNSSNIPSSEAGILPESSTKTQPTKIVQAPPAPTTQAQSQPVEYKNRKIKLSTARTDISDEFNTNAWANVALANMNAGDRIKAGNKQGTVKSITENRIVITWQEGNQSNNKIYTVYSKDWESLVRDLGNSLGQSAMDRLSPIRLKTISGKQEEDPSGQAFDALLRDPAFRYDPQERGYRLSDSFANKPQPKKESADVVRNQEGQAETTSLLDGKAPVTAPETQWNDSTSEQRKERLLAVGSFQGGYLKQLTESEFSKLPEGLKPKLEKHLKSIVNQKSTTAVKEEGNATIQGPKQDDNQPKHQGTGERLGTGSENREQPPEEQGSSGQAGRSNQPEQGGEKQAVTPEKKKQTVVTPNGNKIDTEFEVVELDDLITSDRPEFPSELQPRNRSRVASEIQVDKIANRLDPEQLAESRLASDGAPIVGHDQVVESGNGRVMAVRRVYSQSRLADKAAEYRKMIESRGFDTAGMKNPVLVRRRTTNLSTDERKAFTVDANTQNIAGLSPAERAMIHAGRLTTAILDLYQGGDLFAVKNADFVRAFLDRVALNESSEMTTKDGYLNKEGVNRINNAIIARAYSNVDLMDSWLESQDDNTKSLYGALLDVATGMVKLKAKIESNLAPSELDITSDVVSAVQIIVKAKREEKSLKDLISNESMFGEPISPMTGRIVKLLFTDESLRRQISREKIANLFNTYLGYANEVKMSDPLFADVPNVTVNDIVKSLEDKKREGNKPVSTGSLFSGNAPSTSGTANREEVQGPGDVAQGKESGTTELDESKGNGEQQQSEGQKQEVDPFEKLKFDTIHGLANICDWELLDNTVKTSVNVGYDRQRKTLYLKWSEDSAKILDEENNTLLTIPIEDKVSFYQDIENAVRNLDVKRKEFLAKPEGKEKFKAKEFSGKYIPGYFLDFSYLDQRDWLANRIEDWPWNSPRKAESLLRQAKLIAEKNREIENAIQENSVAPVEPKKQKDKVAPVKQEKEPIISEKEQEPKESSPPTEASKKESNYGKSNTVFTEDAAAKARALLKKKLGQLNSGLDPELVQAGITLAGYHVEAGARGFAAYAKAMLDDLGDTARPFLRSWYEALRYYPGFNSKDMTPLSEMDQVEKNLDTIFNKGQAKQQEQPKETTETQVSYDTTVDKIISDNGILIQTGNRAWSTSGTAPTVFVDVPRGSNLIVNSNDVEAFTKPHHFDKDTGFYYVNFQGNRVFAAGPFRNPSVRFIDHVYKSYLGETTNTKEMKKRIKAMAKKMVDDVEYRKQVITEGLAYAIADSKKLTIERGPAFTSGTTTRPVRARSETVLERLRNKIRGLTRSANYISKRVAAERQLTEDNRRPVSRGTVNLISRGLAKGMPQQVIDWQIDDIAKALTNYRAGKPSFMLSADPGSGKTFTLGGFMRDVLAEDPQARILYFTNSNTLIDQIRNQDLPDYGVNDGRVDIITYSRIQNPQNATITHSDGKSLIEIGDNQILVDDNTILVFDEAHKVKNILDSGEGARNASELMQRAKFTLYSSATPFETVDEAEYLANSGMFEEYDELAESEDLSYKDIRLTGFQVWAIEHGADLSFQKGKDGSVDQISIRWPNAPRFSLPANVGNTEKIAAIREFEAAQLEFMVNQFESGREARQWFIQRNLLTHRPISLGTLKSGEQASVTHLTPVAGSKDFYDNYYNVVVGIYDTALADDSEEAQKLRPTILMQRENIKKRMAEIAKLEETANLVKKDLSSNPDRKALVFVKVKAPLEFGKFKVWDDVEDATGEKRILKKIDRLIAGKDNTTLDKISNDKYQGNKERSISALKSLKDQLKDRRFDSNEISLLESEWSDYLGAMVEVTKSQNGVTWTEIENQGMFSGYSRFMAKAFMDAGLSDLRLDSPVQILENLLAKDFGNDSIVGYNGSLSEVQNVKNREAWKQERSGPRIMIATMDKGGTGLSLQDTTGNRPTFQYNVAIPYTATEFEQVSGRIARYGLQSQANVYWLFANDMPDQFDFRWAKILQERLYNQQGLVKGDVSDTAQNLNAENVLGENKEGNQYSIGDNQGEMQAASIALDNLSSLVSSESSLASKEAKPLTDYAQNVRQNASDKTDFTNKLVSSLGEKVRRWVESLWRFTGRVLAALLASNIALNPVLNFQERAEANILVEKESVTLSSPQQGAIAVALSKNIDNLPPVLVSASSITAPVVTNTNKTAQKEKQVTDYSLFINDIAAQKNEGQRVSFSREDTDPKWRLIADNSISKANRGEYLSPMEHAWTMLGQEEGDNKQIQKILDHFGSKLSQDKYPWCAPFIAYTHARAGIKGVNTQSARAFLTKGKAIDKNEARPGDVVVMWNDNPDTGGRTGFGGHVGYLVKQEGEVMWVLGGNQRDAVNVTMFHSDRLLGIRRIGERQIALNSNANTNIGNQYSIGDNQEAKTPLTVEQARAEVATLIGENQLAAMEKLGKITFHAVNPTNQPNAQAFVDEKGNIHFVVENIQGNFAGIALHEDLHLLKDKGISESQRKIIRLSHAVLALSGLKNFVGNASYDELVKQAHRMAEEGNPHAVKALAKAKEVSPNSPDSEFVNYLVEYAPAHIPFVRRVMSKIRAVLYRMGIKVELRPEDLRELALSAFKQRANQVAKAQAEQAKRIKQIDKQAARYEEKYGSAALQDKRVEVLRSLESDTTQEEYSKKVLKALRFSFAGENAKTADLTLLQQAQQRVNAGEDPELVWQDTGWNQGVDKKWRFEIDDSKATWKTSFNDIPESKLFGKEQPLPLTDVIDHPYLFEAYPQLSKISVIKRPGFLDFGGLQGWFDDKLLQIGLTPYAKDPLSTLLHEIQHVIQMYEGFAKGGNENSVWESLPIETKENITKSVLEKLNEKQEKIKERFSFLDKIDNIDDLDKHISLVKGYEEYIDDLYKKRNSFEKGTDEYNNYNKKWFDATSNRRIITAPLAKLLGVNYTYELSQENYAIFMAVFQRGKTTNELRDIAHKDLLDISLKITEVKSGNEAIIRKEADLYNFYRRLAGETESRLTQARQKMTAEERKAKYPKSMQEYPDNELIIVNNNTSNNEISYSIAPSELPIETAKILGEDSSWNLNPDLQGRVVAALRNPLQTIKVGVEKARPVWLGLLDRQMLVEMIENLPGVGPIAIQFQKTARKLDAMKQELKQKMYPVAEALAEQIARSRDKGYKFSRLLYGSTLHQVDPLGLPPDPAFVGASYDEKQRFAEKEKWYKIVKGWADELERENPALFKLYKEMRANYDYMLNERFNALMARLGRSSEDVVTSLLDHAKSKAEKNIDPMVQQLSQLQRDNDKTYRSLKTSLMAVMPQLYQPKKVTIHNYLNPPKAPAPQPVSVIRSKLDASARPLFDAMMERLENATTDGDLQRKIFFGLMAKAEYLTREQGKPGSLSLSGKLASLYKANPKEFDALQTALSAYLSKPNSVIKYEMVPSKRNPNVTIRTISVVDLQNDQLSVEARANLSEEAQKLFVEAARNSQDQIKESAGAIKYFYETAMAQGPYANLMRYGKYEIYAEKEGEKLPIFAKFEDPRDQKRAALALQAEGWTVNSGYQIENRVFEQAPTGSFVGNLIGLVDDVVKNEQEKATLKDDINQLYLASLPDMSASKHFMHRKGIPGFSQDALRGYAQFMNQSANAIARLNFSDIMIRNLRDLKKANDALGVPYDEESSKMQAMAGSVINELNDSYEWQMNPTNSTLANRITGLGFFWYLTNFSTALINMSQVPLMTFPDLAARYGAKNATSEIMKAVKEYGKWKFNWGEGKKKAEEAIDARFDGDMGRMLQFLEKTGAKSRTETVSLAGMGEEDAYFSSNPVVMWANKFAKALSFPFQQSEIANREISAIAAYTLARQAAKDKTPEDAHQYAQEIAYNTVFRTQNDFSNANRARYWRSDLARILLLFKSYAKLMTWRQLRDAHQVFKEIPSNLTGEDKARFEEEKQIAKHRLAYMGAASLVFGGAMGFPLYTVFITIANAFFGNDPDDPYDVETEVNQALQSMAMSLTNNEQSADLIRQTVMKGPVGALMGSDLSPRLSLDLARLWFRKIPEQKTGEQWGLAALQQAAGPVFGGMFIGAAKGTHDIIQGINQGNTSDVSRGVEGILPAPARNAIKTWRYLTQGVETRRGDKIVDDLSAYEAAMQAIGFAPARVADQYDRNAAMMEVKGWLDTRRKNLINGYVYAVENQDYKKANEFMKDITEFNVKNPSLWIKQDSLIKAMKQREKVRANSNGGLYIPSKGMRARLEEERY